MSASRRRPRSYPTLEEAVAAYAAAADESFTHEEATEAVESTLRDLPTDLGEAVDIALWECPLVFEDAERACYVPRRRYFQGSRFLIQPTPEEVRQKMLVPGHRLMPFCCLDLFPPRCRVQWGENRVAPCRSIRMPIGEIATFFTLFGMHGMISYLLTDADENEALLSGTPDPEASFRLTVFDMSELFAEQGFAEGDALRCTVEDWSAGIVSVERVPAESLQAEALLRRRWCRAMDESLLAVFDEEGSGLDVDEQLAQAFFRGPDWLRESAPIHIGGYLAESEVVAIHEHMARTMLWRTDEAPDDLLSAADQAAARPPTGRCDSLAAILGDIGFAMAEEEVEAYMRDALWKGTDGLDRVVGRILKDRSPVGFYDRRQENAFHRLTREKWQDVRASYDRAADASRGAMRSRVLEVLDRQTALLRECDRRNLDFEDLPREESLELAHLSVLISQVLVCLNLYDASDAHLAELDPMVDHLIERCEQAAECLRAALPGDAGPDLKVLQREHERPRAVYQLKITLKGLRPPIWRRVQVLDDTTLDELHEVIQAAMGWHGGHLHCFEIAGRDFGVSLEEDPFDPSIDDETDVLLSGLIDEEGDTFRYLYDFGDGWEHAMLLEKVLPAEEDVDYPRCIKGRRACPPEDCGGVPGYLFLVDALANEAHPEHADMREWLGRRFHPDAFDLEETNVCIADRCHLPRP